MNEDDFKRLKRGKWSQRGIPHKGWICTEIEDLEEPSLTCEMCESQIIRYVHTMTHPDLEEKLKVGCVCAGYMEDDLIIARKRDSYLKSRAGKRKRWLTRKWKTSSKGNDYLKVDGYLITVFYQNSNWCGLIKELNGSYEKYSSRNYGTSTEIKLACFDMLTKILAEE